MNKQANIQKAIALMKSKGMSAEKALRAVYPDWDDAKIQKAAMTIRTMDKTAAVMQVSSAMVELEKTAEQKMTFSPAMDNSPLLKGKQSKLPDQIQAKILKGKLKKKEEKDKPVKDKVASPSLIGLRYASNAMYANHLRKVTGQEKTANIFMRMAGAPAIKNWAMKGGLGGGVAGGGAEALRLFNLAKSGKAPVAVGKGVTPASLQADQAFIKAYTEAGGKKGAKGVFEFIKQNPGKALELAGGQIGKGALAGAGIGAAGGAAAAKVGQNIAKNKMLDTAKKVAVPAAIGAGGYALLSS